MSLELQAQGRSTSNSSIAAAATKQKQLCGAGKRKEDDAKFCEAGAGSKKNRAALDSILQPFRDVTNVNQQQQAPLKAAQLAGRRIVHTGGPVHFQAANPAAGLVEGSDSYGRGRPTSQGPATPPTESESSLAVQAVQDIDIADEEDPLSCTAYVADIMENIFAAERRRRPLTSYMSSVQTDINEMMRAILVDWLVEVAQEYKLVADTMYLAISYMDRFLSLQPVPRNRLQLVGVTCMLVASKYEEIYAPLVEDFCYITDNTYPREDILAMEADILGGLRFELTAPTPKTFLRRFLKAAAADVSLCGRASTTEPRLEAFASYITELSLLEYAMLQFLPSQIAASAVLVARQTLGLPPWTPTLAHYTTYSAPALRLCAVALHKLLVNACKPAGSLPAVHEKYSHPKHSSVACLPVRDALPEWAFA